MLTEYISSIEWLILTQKYTCTSPDSEAKEKLDPSGKKGISRNSSKAASRDPSRPPSAIDNHIDYFREPVSSSRCTYLLMTNSTFKKRIDKLSSRTGYVQVVKSPPEPTRVKSPEQLHMRSPDPINWTVSDFRNSF